MVKITKPDICHEYKGTFQHAPPTIQLLSHQIKDGFVWNHGAPTPGGYTTVLYARQIESPPPGIDFSRYCGGGLAYFKLEGVRYSVRRSDMTRITNVYGLLRYYGIQHNPDSISIELLNAGSESGYYISYVRNQLCDKCFATDSILPKIPNCPTQTLKYPLVRPTVGGVDVLKFSNITPTDNCNWRTDHPEYGRWLMSPDSVRNPQVGQVIAYQLAVHDAHGNIKHCDFKVQLVAPPAPTHRELDGSSAPIVLEKLLPNPNEGAFQLQLQSRVEEEVTFDIYNSLGEQVYTKSVALRLGENHLVFEVESLPIGIYFVQVRQHATSATRATFIKY
jgi:hypothetical protein